MISSKKYGQPEGQPQTAPFPMKSAAQIEEKNAGSYLNRRKPSLG
jgi:hypothetical protein